jgi:hypothetical protein
MTLVFYFGPKPKFCLTWTKLNNSHHHLSKSNWPVPCCPNANRQHHFVKIKIVTAKLSKCQYLNGHGHGTKCPLLTAFFSLLSFFLSSAGLLFSQNGLWYGYEILHMFPPTPRTMQVSGWTTEVFSKVVLGFQNFGFDFLLVGGDV